MLAGGRNAAGRRISDVRVLSAEEMQPGFHARFDCRGKTYRYVFSTGAPSVFRQKYCYFVDPKMCALPEGRLDLTAMDRAASLFTGTHDFAAFQSAGGTPRETTVRTVFGADVRQVGAPEPEGAGTGTAAGADVPAVPHAQPGDYVFTFLEGASIGNREPAGSGGDPRDPGLRGPEAGGPYGAAPGAVPLEDLF